LRDKSQGSTPVSVRSCGQRRTAIFPRHLGSWSNGFSHLTRQERPENNLRRGCGAVILITHQCACNHTSKGSGSPDGSAPGFAMTPARRARRIRTTTPLYCGDFCATSTRILVALSDPSLHRWQRSFKSCHVTIFVNRVTVFIGVCGFNADEFLANRAGREFCGWQRVGQLRLSLETQLN